MTWRVDLLGFLAVVAVLWAGMPFDWGADQGLSRPGYAAFSAVFLVVVAGLCSAGRRLGLFPWFDSAPGAE